MNRILVVDDQSEVRGFLRRSLERSGYWVREATNGIEAVKLGRQLRPDLVVTDLIMPEREGYEAIAELSARFPGLPILAISGYAEHNLAAALKLGASHCLPKPFTVEELSDAVQLTFHYARVTLPDPEPETRLKDGASGEPGVGETSPPSVSPIMAP